MLSRTSTIFWIAYSVVISTRQISVSHEQRMTLTPLRELKILCGTNQCWACRLVGSFDANWTFWGVSCRWGVGSNGAGGEWCPSLLPKSRKFWNKPRPILLKFFLLSLWLAFSIWLGRGMQSVSGFDSKICSLHVFCCR